MRWLLAILIAASCGCSFLRSRYTLDDPVYAETYAEKDWNYDRFLFNVYPEVGVHAWLDGNWRFTTFGRYLISSEGRDSDDGLLGLQLTRFSRKHQQ